MTELIPGLWISGLEGLTDDEFLTSKRISLVINCTTDVPMQKRIPAKRIPVTDSSTTVREEADQIMFSYLADITKSIHLELGRGGCVLVHCFAGKQRSATVGAAYLIRYGQMPLIEAERALQSKRPAAFSPHNNFRTALSRFEKLYARAGPGGGLGAGSRSSRPARPIRSL
jgi:hypothetical protein